MACLLTSVNNQVHDEDRWQIPQWSVQRFGPSVLMLKQDDSDDGFYGCEPIRYPMLHIISEEPIRIYKDVVKQIGCNKA